MSGGSLFSPTENGQDLGLSLLSQLTVSGSQTLESAAPLRDIIQKMLGLYSSAILVIAGFIAVYYVILTIVDTAQTGKAFRKVNPVWGPLRLVFAICLLVPLPSSVGAGLNTGQYMVLGISKWGSDLASEMWSLATRDIKTLQPMVSQPKPVSALALVRGLVLRDACSTLTTLFAQQQLTDIRHKQQDDEKNNRTPQAYEATLFPIAAQSMQRNADGSQTTPYGWADRPYFCGGVTLFPATSGESALASAIKNGHQNALKALEQQTSAFADDYISTLNGQPPSLKRSPQLLAERYESTLRDAMGLEFKAQLKQHLEDVRQKIDASGWVGAPAYLDTLLRLNTRMLALVGSLPQIDPPELMMNPPPAPPSSSATPTYEYRIYALLEKIDRSWGSTPQIPPLSAAGFSGLSLSLSHAVTTAHEISGAGAMGHQLRATRDLLSTDDYDWAALASANPLVGLSELSTYLNGKSAQLLAGAGVLNSVGPVTGPTVVLISALGLLAFVTSVVLLLLVPLIPLVQFLLGVAIWLLQVLEALVAMPLVALAHLRAEEDGLAGQSAVTCYILIMQVALRPVLMIFGLIGGLVVMMLMLGVLNALLANAMPGVLDSGQMASLWFVLISAVYAVMVIGVTNAAFKLINWLPARTLTWLSGLMQPASKRETQVNPTA